MKKKSPLLIKFEVYSCISLAPSGELEQYYAFKRLNGDNDDNLLNSVDSMGLGKLIREEFIKIAAIEDVPVKNLNKIIAKIENISSYIEENILIRGLTDDEFFDVYTEFIKIY